MEIQDRRPQVTLPLERIGFRNVRRRIRIDSPEGPIHLDVSMDLYISIGPDRRGAHLSRNIEAVIDALEDGLRGSSIEDYLEKVARRLLERHGYALSAEVIGRTVYYVDIEYAGIRGKEPVSVEIAVMVERTGRRIWSVSVSMAGLSVCPSAQTTIAATYGYQGIPAPSHSQKVILTGKVTATSGMARIEDIAVALSKSFSAPSITLLKRPQEARLVFEAHRRPRLAEDIARIALREMAHSLKGKVPGDAILEAEVVSLESIHPHDVYALARSSLDAVLAISDRDLHEQH